MVDETKLEGLGRVVSSGKIHQINHLQLEAVWHKSIYQLESKSSTMTGDKAVGGANGVANVQAKELGDRTECLYNAVSFILNYLKKYTPDGITKIPMAISETQPADSNLLWLKVSGETLDDDPEFLVTTHDGEQFYLLDGKTIITVDGVKYALVGASGGLDSDVDFFPTVPSSSGEDTVPGGDITIPSGEDTIPGGDITIPSGEDTVPGGNITIPSGDNDTNYASQEDLDTLQADLWGDATAPSDEPTISGGDNDDDYASFEDLETLQSDLWGDN